MEKNNIKKYIEVCYLDYSVNKWIEIFLAGYKSDERKLTEVQQEISEEQEESQEGIGGNNTDDLFDEIALANLQSIMEKYGICKSEAGYKQLTEVCFAIAPDAYLGTNYGTHFTVAGLYLEGIDATNTTKWKYMAYEEICIEKITIRQEGKKQYILVVPDANGNRLRYSSTKEICEELSALLFEIPMFG